MADQTARLEAATVKAEVGSGILYRFSNDSASDADIPTLSGDIPNLKKIILTIQNDGADKISFATRIFPSTAAGIAGTQDQEIFLVQSGHPDEIYAVWQNVSGTAVDTGKRSLSAAAVTAAMQAATDAAISAQDSADTATARVARFLGPSAVEPSTRDDGQPLQVGDQWPDITNGLVYNWTGSAWVALNSSAQELEARLELPTGTTEVGHEGVTAAFALNTTPYDIRRFGGKPNDPTFNNLVAIKAALAKYGIAEIAGGVYTVNIATESDTLTEASTPTGNITLIFKDGAIRHTAVSLVLIYLNAKTLSFQGNPKFIYAGTYPANAGAVTKYGDSQTSDAHFCGFVVLKGISKIISPHIIVEGETDSNRYDFFFRGSFGTFIGSRIESAFLSHYARAFADNIYGMTMGTIEGTKRHNASSNHYGPSHLVYANFNKIEAEAFIERGVLLSNENGDAGATIQSTNFYESHIASIICTMDGVSTLSLKVGAANWSIGSIISKSDGFTTDPANANRPLVDIQTNLQNQVIDGRIGFVDIVMPATAPNRTGLWLGGGNITAKARIKAPDYGVKRNAPLAAMVTSRDSELELDIDTDRTDDHVYMSLADRARLTIENRLNPVLVKTGLLYTGASWGVCKGCRVEFLDSPMGESSVNWASTLEEANNSVVRRVFAQNIRFKQVVNLSGLATLSAIMPIDPAVYTLAGTTNNLQAYDLTVTAGELNGNFAGSAKYLIVSKSGSSLGKTFVATQLSLYNSAVGSQAVVFAIAGDTTANTLSVSASVTTGLLGNLHVKLEKITGLYPRSF